MTLPIVAIAVLGILTTSIFLFTYYVFVIKCCLTWRCSDILLRLFSSSRHHTFPLSTEAAESGGLDPAAIRSIPAFLYSSPDPSFVSAECAVCLLDFRSGERLRQLPSCAHAFHIDCIDAWLQSKASCPLCRSQVTDMFNSLTGHLTATTVSVVIEPSEEETRNQRRRLGHAVSMGDECIGIRREKVELFTMQPLRRSFSLDSSGDRRLYSSIQECLRQNLELGCGEGGSNSGSSVGGGSGRGRRLFFTFGHGRSWRSAVRPVDICV